ncbi:MAG: hypothetical protein IKS40_04190 [Treponema sp.]|nr:hypothetical protein [Treponema sp.]
MKKLMMGFAALLAAMGFAFAETEISFTNKLYMEDAFWGHDDAADENVKFFAPVKNKFDLQLESEKLSGQVKGIVYFMDFGGETYGFAGELKDAWVEFRPIEQIGLAFRENIVAWPSTLPIYDDDLQSGNIGSNGFTAWYAPSPLGGALKIAATVPIDWYLNDATYAVVAPNYFNGKDSEGNNNKFNFGLGAAYTHELFEISFSAGNIINNDARKLGGTVGFPNLFGAVENLNLGFGYEYNKEGDGYSDFINYLTVVGGVGGQNLFNAVLTYEGKGFAITAEGVTNFSEDSKLANETHDIYGALEFDLGLTEQLTLALTGKILSDFTPDDRADGGSTLKNAYMGGAGLAFAVNEHHELGAGFEAGYQNKSYAFAVPVFWKYTY